jgi:hypothetical protein
MSDIHQQLKSLEKELPESSYVQIIKWKP